MRKLISILFILSFLNCQLNDNKCGIIIQKIDRETSYYFVIQTDEYINIYNNPSQPNLPDDGIRQGIVSKEVYENFEIGDEYCSEI